MTMRGTDAFSGEGLGVVVTGDDGGGDDSLRSQLATAMISHEVATTRKNVIRG